jgi:Raf kinase inhibitor-like YbhB/YbcL family protein
MKDKLLLIVSFALLTGCSTVRDPIPTQLPADDNHATSPAITDTDFPADATNTIEPTPESTPISFTLSSPVFGGGSMIPAQYSRKGDDISPPLEWGEPPEGTKSFALILFSDPVMDGGGNWTHWVLYNIPPNTRSLKQGIQPDNEGLLPDGSKHFKNSWGEFAYGGPNPQHAQTFNYYFKLYALDSVIDLDEVELHMEEAGTLPWIGSSQAVLEEAIAGRILGLGELTAAYKEELN